VFFIINNLEIMPFCDVTKLCQGTSRRLQQRERMLCVTLCYSSAVSNRRRIRVTYMYTVTTWWVRVSLFIYLENI